MISFADDFIADLLWKGYREGKGVVSLGRAHEGIGAGCSESSFLPKMR